MDNYKSTDDKNQNYGVLFSSGIIAIIPICFLKNYKRKIVLTIVSTILQITIKHSSLMVAILSVIVIL